jgi:hypothetical protein
MSWARKRLEKNWLAAELRGRFSGHILEHERKRARDPRRGHGSDQYTIDPKGFFIRGWRKMITSLRLEQRSGITRERAWELAAALSCTSNAAVCPRPCDWLVFRQLQLIRLDSHSFSTAIELSYIPSWGLFAHNPKERRSRLTAHSSIHAY